MRDDVKDILTNPLGLFLGSIFLIASAVIVIGQCIITNSPIAYKVGDLVCILVCVNLPVSILWVHFLVNTSPIITCVIVPVTSAIQWYLIGTVIYAVPYLLAKKARP